MRLINCRALYDRTAKGLTFAFLAGEERREDTRDTITTTLWCLPLDDSIKVFGELEGPITDVSEEGIRLVVAVEVGEAVEERGGKLLSLALESLCEEGFTLCDGFALASTKCCLDLDLRISGRHEVEPSRLGLYHLTRQDLDLISIGEAVGEREHLVIDLGPDTGVSEIGVDSIGEVQDRGIKW